MAWGETLGCAASYTVTIHYQGGQRVYAYLDAVEEVTWSRVRRGVSEAQVTLSAQALTAACAEQVARLWPLAHEVTIYRNDRAVWQGPLVRRVSTRAEHTTKVVLYARDVGYWLGRRLTRTATKITGDLAEVGQAVVASTLAVRDPNVLPHVVARPTGRTITHTIHPYGRAGLEELSAVAAQGLEWSAVGRTLYLSGAVDETSPSQGQLASQDLQGEVELDVDGDQYASLVYAAPQAQEGVYQHLEGVGGASPYFGLVEYTVQTDLSWNLDEAGNFSPTGEEGDALTEQETIQALRRAAQSRHTQMSRPPIVVRVSDGARLSPDAPISLDRLVPGGRVDVALAAEDFLFPLVRPMRLMRVDVTWTQEGEAVEVGMVQIGTSSDNEVEEV